MQVRKGCWNDASGDGGPAIRARLLIVQDLALDGRGNLYLTESEGHRIRKVDAAGIITTIAGDGTAGFRGDGGPATAARVNSPFGIAADSAGNVYIADTNNARVRRINSAGIITTIAGETTASTGWPYFGENGIRMRDLATSVCGNWPLAAIFLKK